MGLEKVLDDIVRKGKLEAKEEIVKNMIKMGMDTAFIVQAIGVPEKKVEKLRK